MFRATICLVLVFQMLVPTAALARFVGLNGTFTKPATESTVSEATPTSDKICCCTHKPGCHCCGDDASDSDRCQTTPSPRNETRIPTVHCKCPDLDPLNLDVHFFGHLRPSCFARFDPPQIDTLHTSSDTYLSAYLAIDPHPPRHSL